VCSAKWSQTQYGAPNKTALEIWANELQEQKPKQTKDIRNCKFRHQTIKVAERI
jgi:hypothetical protein